MRVRPESGANAPERTLSRVLLPTPVARMRSCPSPGPTTSEAFRNAATAPYRLATSLASSSSSVMRLARSMERGCRHKAGIPSGRVAADSAPPGVSARAGRRAIGSGLAGALAGQQLVLGVRGPVGDRDPERPRRIDLGIVRRGQLLLARVGRVVPHLGLDERRLLGRRLTVEDLERQLEAGAADRCRVRDRGTLETLLVQQLLDEACVVRADDRHDLVGALERVDDDVVDTRRPDAVERLPGREERVDLLDRGRLLPARLDFGDDLDARVLGEGSLEALVAVGVRGRAGGAAHVDDVALAVELLEQPLAAEVAVLLLVVGHEVRAGLRDGLVDRDDGDALVERLLDRRVDGVRADGVDDDRVDALGDEVADVLELAGSVGVPMRHGELADLARGGSLRLDRADHLLAPAVALNGVRDADLVGRGAAAGRGRAAGRCAARSNCAA